MRDVAPLLPTSRAPVLGALPGKLRGRGAAAILASALALWACDRTQRVDPGQSPESTGSARPGRPGESETRDLYLNLMKLSLTDLLYENDPVARSKRIRGGDWPSRAYTMIGLKRLDNLQVCIEDTLAHGVPGDLIEAGAWRGGATIMMRAVLKAYGVTDRTVWVADSFEGMPAPDPERFPDELMLDLSENEYLAVSQEEVERNFRRYRLLDDQVKFLKGWFKDSLPGAPIGQLALVRLDADLYESTTDALTHLYPKLSSGGCLIVDDYFIRACRQAVHDYREKHGISEPIQRIDHKSVYWKKR